MKTLFTLTTALLIATLGFAQSFSISNETTTVSGDGSATLHGAATVTNNAHSNLSVHCSREDINVGAGSSNYFCWTQCYGNTTDVSPIATVMDAGTSTNIFTSYYDAGGFVGVSVVRYCFFDENHTTDQMCFDISYTTTATGIVDALVSGTNGLSPSFPNPAISSTEMKYSIAPGAKNARVEMYNMLGAKVNTFQLIESEGILTIDVEAVPSGLYFLNMTVDGKNVSTRKVLVTK